jgi:hypothetical protein
MPCWQAEGDKTNLSGMLVDDTLFGVLKEERK